MHKLRKMNAMKIIYLTYDVEKKFVGEKSAERLEIELVKVPILLWEQYEEVLAQANMVLIEHSKSTIASEKYVLEISSKLPDLSSCIILTHDMNFKEKTKYYNLGISAIIDTSEIIEDELEQYFLLGLNEYETIRYLQEMRVAVVDDSRLSLEIVRSYFERCDAKNTEYYQEPEKLLGKVKDYDLFLVDLVMPKYTGQELIHYIRRENKDAIIIIITTYGEGISIPYGMNIGADDFLIKPFDFKLFLLRLMACVRNQMLYNEKRDTTKKLYELATKDYLTNVYNRRFFVEYMETQMRESRHENKIFSMILLDIDHFKNINDEFGHLEGDNALCKVAKMVQSQLRGTDVVCRWGGEEFAVFLPQTKLYDAELVAEKLRKSIMEIHVKNLKQLSASFGVTQYLDSDDIESIFKRIDNSLYLAKLTGRNKVISNENIFMYKNGVPLNIEWGSFFRSGNKAIDQEHNLLINLSNELIANCFIEELQTTAQLVEKIYMHMIDHFYSEEEVLQEYDYEALQEHRSIHKALIKSMKTLMDSMYKGETEPIDLARYIIQEIVVGHIIKYDFQFFEIFAPGDGDENLIEQNN